MKKLITLIVLATLFVSLQVKSEKVTANKSTKQERYTGLITKDYNFKDFDALVIGNAFKIIVHQSENYDIKITGSKEDIENVKIIVNDNELQVSIETSFLDFSGHDDLTIEIKLPHLRKIDFSGATVSVVKGFNLENLNVNISGASTSKLYVNADRINLDVSGASSVKLIGEGNELQCDVSGASTFNAYTYKTTIANLDASGASSAKLYTTKKLIADASGASSITYKGEARLEGDYSVASSIKKLN